MSPDSVQPREDIGTVRVLLGAARLTVSEEELAWLARTYPVLRSQADGLYLPELADESPAMTVGPLGYG